MEFGRSFVNIVDQNPGGTMIDMLRVHETENYQMLSRAGTMAQWQGPGQHLHDHDEQKHNDDRPLTPSSPWRMFSCFGALWGGKEPRTLPVTATQERQSSPRET